ncbi:hypothetical protein QQP08_012750 [Theobroma cacao]|nr:hypothetical protein QQP08_012750 [Theobroma cacao]
MLPLIVYLVSLHLLFSVTIAGNSAAYSPIDYILLSCGASLNSISEDGRKWIPDEKSKFSTSNSVNSSFASTASRQDHAVTQVPYMTARVFRDIFTYSFPMQMQRR